MSGQTTGRSVEALGSNNPSVIAVKPAAKKQKPSGREKVDRVLQEIRSCLSKPDAGRTRDERTDALVGALALALSLIELANVKGNKGTRKALVKKVHAIEGERTPRRPAKLLLQVVKVCFPKSKISDQSQYTRFIAGCLIQGWSSEDVERRFDKLRAKSRQRRAAERAAGKRGRPAMGIKEFAKKGNKLLKTPRMLNLRLPHLLAALRP